MIELGWWVQAIEIPVVVGLVWLIWNTRALAMTIKDDLADHKLEVAKNYVSIRYLKDVEKRLTDHLKAIEEKLDRIQEHRS